MRSKSTTETRSTDWSKAVKVIDTVSRKAAKQDKSPSEEKDQLLAPIFSAFQTTPFIVQNFEQESPCEWKYLFIFGVKIDAARETLYKIIDIEDYVDIDLIHDLQISHVIADKRGDGIIIPIRSFETNLQHRTLRGEMVKTRSGKSYRLSYPASLLTESEFRIMDKGGARFGTFFGAGGQSNGETAFRHQNLKLFLKKMSNDAPIILLPFQIYLKKLFKRKNGQY